MKCLSHYCDGSWPFLNSVRFTRKPAKKDVLRDFSCQPCQISKSNLRSVVVKVNLERLSSIYIVMHVSVRSKIRFNSQRKKSSLIL